MSIVGLVILLIVVGAALYLLQLVPMDGTVKQVIKVLVIVVLVIVVVIFLAQLVGLSTGGPPLRIR